MRLNVRTPKRDKAEEHSHVDHWQDWQSIRGSPTSPSQTNFARSYGVDRAKSSEEVWENTVQNIRITGPTSERTTGEIDNHSPIHRRQASRALSDELNFRQHVTRDSMVDNLLSTFDQLPEGSTTYPPTTPTVPNFSQIYSQPESPRYASHTANHQRIISDPASISLSTTSQEERFSPYQIRQTSIRRHDPSHIPRLGSNQTPAFDMDSDAPRPSTHAGQRHGKSKSKGSNKSLDMATNVKDPLPSQQRGEYRGEALGQGSTENRRRSRTGPSSNSTSILDRARPIPAEYHDFNILAPGAHETSRKAPPESFSSRPTIFHRSSEGPPGDRSRLQISTRNKVGTLTGSDQVLAGNQQHRPSATAAPHIPSLQLLTPESTNGSSANSPAVMKHQPSVESTKSRQGFFRRVFGPSRSNTPHPPSPTPQLRPVLVHSLSSTKSSMHFHNDTESQSPSVSKVPSKMFNSDDLPPPAAPRDAPQLVHKKSSFFRRRKRSESNKDMTVDIQSALGSSETSKEPATPSASSLRQAMDSFMTQSHSSDHSVTISPVEQKFYDSHEQQPDRDNVFSFASANDNDNDTGKASLDASTIKADRTPRQDQSQAIGFNGPTMLDHGPSPSLKSGLPNVADLNPNSSNGLHHQTPTPSTTRNDESAVPSSMSKRTASSTAQLTGQLIPAEDESPVDDWVASTPFKRPAVMRPSPKPARSRFEPTEAELLALERDRSLSVPWVSHDAKVRPSITHSLSAQTVPTVILDPKASLANKTCSAEDEASASKLFNNHTDPTSQGNAALVLGKQARNGLRQAYMALFDFAGVNILSALRDLCGRLALKGETQQVDRIISAFADRWCECNPLHGFKSPDVVHTICYSILLLNTDLHIADVEQKMTKAQFVKNTLSTLSVIAHGDSSGRPSFAGSHASSSRNPLYLRDGRSPSPAFDGRPSTDDRLRVRTSVARPDSTFSPLASPNPFHSKPTNAVDLLVAYSFDGTTKGWESQIATILKEFYSSIRAQRLPLHGASELQLQGQESSNNLTVNTSFLRRAGSVVSKSGSDGAGRSADGRSAPTSWNNRGKSRPKMYPSSTFGSSTTSFEDSPVFSPTASSTWSRSLGKGPTAMSSDSLASAFTRAEQHLNSSIGFASALSNAIIREEEGSPGADAEVDVDLGPSATLLDDESLGLEGAPWAKEGIVQHKHHLESTDKRNRDRNWVQSFAVVERGRLRLFSFNTKTAGRSRRNKIFQPNAVVGGGNWMDNAEELASFNLRQTLANELPPPGYSAKRPHVFVLMFPTGALHLFEVGTPEIAREFVSSANYWAARLSKEPLVGGVSNIEYGWSDAVLNSALLPRATSAMGDSESGSMKSPSARLHSPTPSSFSNSMSMSRPSFQGSVRGTSIDLGGKARLPGDRAALSEWMPPQQSLGSSELKESKQLEALRKYVADVEDQLRVHGDLRAALTNAYAPRSPNLARALSNWERRSSYLLREVVKFRTYIDTLVAAQAARERVYRDRAEADQRSKALLEGREL